MNTRAVLIGFAVLSGIAILGGVMQYQQGYVDYDRMLSIIHSSVMLFILIWMIIMLVKYPMALVALIITAAAYMWVGFPASLIIGLLSIALIVLTKNKGK